MTHPSIYFLDPLKLSASNFKPQYFTKEGRNWAYFGFRIRLNSSSIEINNFLLFILPKNVSISFRTYSSIFEKGQFLRKVGSNTVQFCVIHSLPFFCQNAHIASLNQNWSLICIINFTNPLNEANQLDVLDYEDVLHNEHIEDLWD